MTLKIEIEMENAAFFDDDKSSDTAEPARNPEVARILHTLAQTIDRAWELEEGHGFALMDTNGNKVGQATVT